MAARIDAADFLRRFGRKPVNDDLQRVNCKKAGQRMHYGCGVCVHDRPAHDCAACFVARVRGAGETRFGVCQACGCERELTWLGLCHACDDEAGASL